MVAVTPKILVIGGTGTIGKFMVEASAKAGHPTFALVRETTLSNPAKSPIIQKFKRLGVHLVLVRKSPRLKLKIAPFITLLVANIKLIIQ